MFKFDQRTLLVRLEGLEPPAPKLEVLYSIQLSYSRIKSILCLSKYLLYQDSYLLSTLLLLTVSRNSDTFSTRWLYCITVLNCCQLHKRKKSEFLVLTFFVYGAGWVNRTPLDFSTAYKTVAIPLCESGCLSFTSYRLVGGVHPQGSSRNS